MRLKKWSDLPPYMQTQEVRKYYEILDKKKISLLAKRSFDFIVSSIMILLLSPFFVVIAFAIKVDSKGPIFYRQERVTRYGEKFMIFKFRSMAQGSDLGESVTVSNDVRVTRVGKFIRKYRLDEISQLFDIWRGTMTFVGTRPEISKYVDYYTDEMFATLLLPAGVTSLASICYKDEATLLNVSCNVDKTYIEEILPSKMMLNLRDIQEFGFWRDIKLMFMTVWAVSSGKHVYVSTFDKMRIEIER